MKFQVLCRAVSDDEVTVGIPPVSPASLGTLCVCLLKPNQAQMPSKHQRRAGSPAEGFSLFLSLSTYSLSARPLSSPYLAERAEVLLVWVNLESWKNVRKEKAYELEWQRPEY